MSRAEWNTLYHTWHHHQRHKQVCHGESKQQKIGWLTQTSVTHHRDYNLQNNMANYIVISDKQLYYVFLLFCVTNIHLPSKCKDSLDYLLVKVCDCLQSFYFLSVRHNFLWYFNLEAYSLVFTCLQSFNF